MTLDPRFLSLPIAHRGLHTGSRSRPENSMAAFEAAAMFGFAIELDVQLTRDGVAAVFHDYNLQRLLSRSGAIQATDFTDLSSARILGSGEAPPNLTDVLSLVAGQVPILIELKDQSGLLTGTTGRLESVIVKALSSYVGPVAVMSFNPDQVIEMRRIAPNIPRGLVTESFISDEWALVPFGRREQLSSGAFINEVDVSFVNHKRSDLDSPLVKTLRDRDIPVFAWTITSEHQELEARRIVQNITFENYLPNA